MGLGDEVEPLEISPLRRDYDDTLRSLHYREELDDYRAHQEGDCPDPCPYPHRHVSEK